MTDPVEGSRSESQNVDLDQRLSETQGILLSRPRISIRLRFVASLALCFCLCALVALVATLTLRKVRHEVLLHETMERLSFQVEQARRYEKDYFLYGTNLADARQSAEMAYAALRLQAPRLARAGWGASAQTLVDHLSAYRALLLRCDELQRAGRLEGGLRESIQSGLRQHGSEIIRLTQDLTASERRSMEDALTSSDRYALFFLVTLLALMVLITYFFTQALMGPIKRFQAYTARIAAGDFTLVRPARPYRDEFTDLALAVNRMLADLQVNQQRCVEAGRLAAVGTITSGIAHELNNPLNNITLTTEALMEDFRSMGDDKKWKLLQDIYFETERASEIVKSLLDFTRMETPESVPVDLPEVIQAAARLVQNEMAITNVSFECLLPPPLPPVRGSLNPFKQVFLNLFINGIQAMPAGGTLRVKLHPHRQGLLCVDVQDTGEGIGADVLPRIFDPFFTTKEPGRGTGLGLSVSRNIVRAYGGDIQVTTEIGKGTTFHVCLPQAG